MTTLTARKIASLLLAWMTTATLIAVGNVNAQEVRKTLHDYWLDRPFTYQPSDPFVRSKLFQIQTKHYGFFYNCDDQECKRNSPYICWKTHYERDLPNTMSCLQRVRHELDQVRQRIYDGAGMCAVGCQCNRCQQTAVPAQAAPCDCADCRGRGKPQPLQTGSLAQAATPPTPVAGLIQRTAKSEPVAVEPESQKTFRMGNYRRIPRQDPRPGSDGQAAPADRMSPGDATAVSAEPVQSANLLDRLRTVRR